MDVIPASFGNQCGKRRCSHNIKFCFKTDNNETDTNRMLQHHQALNRARKKTSDNYNVTLEKIVGDC